MQNLEKIGDKLCRKINNISTVSQQPQWKDVTCSDCNIDGDVTEKCFKSKTFFNYIEVGHIANFVQWKLILIRIEALPFVTKYTSTNNSYDAEVE